MAKLVFYLSVAEQNRDSAIATAASFSSSAFSQQHTLCCALLQPRTADILAIPPDSAFLQRINLVFEVEAPAGEPIASWENELKKEMGPLLALVEPGSSYLVVCHTRMFQASGPKLQRYHYFMVRKKGYSRADYLDYYSNSHYRFGVATPLADYYQNYIDEQATTAAAGLFGFQPVAADNFSELRFDDINAYLHSAVTQEVGPAAGADEALFVDRKKCQSFSMDVLFDSA